MMQRTREQNSIELLVEQRRLAHLLCIDTDAACLSYAIRIGIDRGYLQPVSDQQCRKFARSAAYFEHALRALRKAVADEVVSIANRREQVIQSQGSNSAISRR